MAGTKAGAAKRRKALIKKYGSFANYRKLHAEKYRKSMIKKHGSEDAYLEEQRNRASKGGKIGGLAGRPSSIRTNVDQPESVRGTQYKNENQGQGQKI